MKFVQARCPQGRALGFQAIREEALWADAPVAKQVFHKFQGSAGVAMLPNNKIRTLAFIVDGAPQEHALPADRANHLIEPPARGGRRSATLKLLAICSRA